MNDLQKRLRQDLEPILLLEDPRTRLSAYHDMPYAIFRYDPEDEFELRREVTMLWTPTRSIDELVRERTSPAAKAALKSLLEAPSAVGAAKNPKQGTANA